MSFFQVLEFCLWPLEDCRHFWEYFELVVCCFDRRRPLLVLVTQYTDEDVAHAAPAAAAFAD